jgi:hypothetical protein
VNTKPFTLAFVPYALLFLALSAAALAQPTYTWDLVGYIGSSIDSSNPEFLHQETFGAIRSIKENKNLQLENPYRADIAANPYHFAQQIPLYSIKPVYVALIKGLHHFGVSYPRSAVSISAASNFLLALLLWFWMSPYLGSLPRFAACVLIMLSPNLLELSRWATPDALSTFLAAVGLYLILGRKQYFWGCAALVFDIWVRTDAVVLAGIVMMFLLLRRRIDFPQFASLSILALGSYFVINRFAGNYGWSVLFHESFSGGLVNPGEALTHVSLVAYLRQLVKGSYMVLTEGSFAVYALLAGFALWLKKSSPYSQMAAVVLGSRLVSYALYPNGDQRYTAILYLIVPVALLLAVSSEIADRGAQKIAMTPNAASAAVNAPMFESEPVSHR